MYENQYYDPAHEAGYAGARNLIHVNRTGDPIKNKAEKARIYTWLSNQDAYTLHKSIRRRFPRLHYNVTNIDDVWEGDLAVLPDLKKHNDGYCYIFVLIDILSKYVWVEPLRDKKMTSVSQAFEKILKRSKGRIPGWLQSDSGNEFIGSALQKLLKKHDIRFRVTRNPDIKAACVERFMRTLKTRMWRYFTHKNTKRYIDVLQDIVHAYNHSTHTSIRMLPSEVNLWNAAEARENISKRYKKQKTGKVNKYTIGDYVRISRTKGTFEKGYEYNWSEEVFKVSRVLHRQNIFIYELVDLDAEVIDGFFYPEELTLVGKDRMSRDQQFKVKEIISTRGRGTNKEVLVSWVGYPKKFNSWIKASEVNDI